MRHDLPYPKSFPTPKEAAFLKVAVASDAEFPSLWRQWKDSINWQGIDFATSKLLTYFYPRLRALGISDDFTERVKGVHKSTWVKNQLFLHAAKEIAEICHREKIPLLMLKGIPLISEVYKDSGSRPLGDADILVRPEDGKRLTELLLANDLRFAKEWAADRHNPAPSIYKIIKATELRSKIGIDVDVHYNIFAADHGMSLLSVFLLRDMPSLSYPDYFWQHAVPMELDGVPCLRLSNEDTLIHLIVHGSEGNTYRTFRWVLDSLLLIDRCNIDWDLVFEHAQKFGYVLDLRLAFSYLKEEFGAQIPDSIMDKLSGVPLRKGEIQKYYAVANIEHAKRFRGLGNIPLLWYAYWKFEPKRLFLTKLFGFPGYVRSTWGLTSNWQVFSFALHHYRRKLEAKDPEFFKNVRKAARDSAYVVGGKALSFLASFAVITVMARFVPREVIGSYNYVIAALAIVSIATLPGMNEALTRAIGRGYDASVGYMLRQRLLFGMIGSVLAVVIGAVTWLSGNPELGFVFFIASPFVPLTDTLSNFAVSYWQGKKRFDRSALIGAIYYVGLAAVSIPVLILSQNLVVIVTSILSAQALMGFLVYQSIGKHSGEPDADSAKLGVHLTAMQACGIFASNFDKILLWGLFGPATLAIYAFAATPVSKFYQMLPISILALPHLSAQTFTKETRNNILRNTALLFVLSIPGTAFVIWIAPTLYSVVFPLYPESIPYFQLLFLGAVLSPIAMLRSALVAFKQTKALYFLEVGIPLLRILLLAALALLFGIYGLIVGILLVSLVSAVITLILFLRTKTVSAF